MIWDQLTTLQVEKLDKHTPVILPITATEQHGPHLPLATDRLIGEHFAIKVHEELDDQVLILPPISVGYSKHHLKFSGTLTLSHENFSRQVEDIVDSVIHHGFNRIILLNSHGGNQGVGQVILEKLGDKHTEAHIVMATWWRIAYTELKKIACGFGSAGHAGEFETSIMMMIAPHLVLMDKIKPGTNKTSFSWAEGDLLNAPQAAYFRSMNELTSNGVFGDPTIASREKGKKIEDCVVKALKNIVIDMNGLE